MDDLAVEPDSYRLPDNLLAQRFVDHVQVDIDRHIVFDWRPVVAGRHEKYADTSLP